MDLSEGLNSRQLSAMRHDQGPALIVAGAGTGKTTVITRRIAWLIAEKKARPEEILAVTFTDKAAGEMEERVDLLLPYGVVETNIMTFHSLGERILRDNAFELGLASDFVVMKEFTQALLIEEIVDRLKLEYYRPLGNPYSFVAGLVKHFSRLKDEMISPQKYSHFASIKLKQIQSDEDKNQAKATVELSKIYETYCKDSRSRGWLDFGDLISLVIELFTIKPHVLREYSNKYKYILVDEFQDTNSAQAKLIKLLSKTHQNLFVVGDDDQSIYRFRGASISNIMQFMSDYPKAKQVVLNRNYRSGQDILDGAYRLINYNNPDRLEVKYKIDKRLRGLQKGNPIIQREFDSLSAEMNYVAGEIKSHIDRGVSPGQIAVLLRKNNQTAYICQALDKIGVSYQQSQSVRLFDRPEIRALINFTAVINHPNDNKALFGLMVGDIYQIEMADVVNIAAEASKTHRPMVEVLSQNAGVKKGVQIIADIEAFRKQAVELSAGQLLHDFISETGYLDRLKSESESDNGAALKIQNLARFFNLVREFEAAVKDPNIFSFWRHLDDLTTTQSVEIMSEQSPLDTDAVQVLTVHRAKGLEYQVVFMIDLCHNTFPSTNRKDMLPIDDELLELDHPHNWHQSEERRLFYVAMTRAKESLYLTNAVDHGGKRLKKMSSFVVEAVEQVQHANHDGNAAALAQLESFSQPKLGSYDPVAVFYNDGWLHLSTNQIANYIRSPREFWFFDVLNLPKSPFHALVYGSAIHAAIEFYYKNRLAGQPVVLEKLYQVFEDAWSNEGFVSLAHEERRYARGQAVLKAFHQREEKKKDFPIEVEKAFHLMLPELKLRISGRYDAVFARGEGVEIRDFKTGEVDTEKKAADRLKKSIQLQIYALAWERHTKTPVKDVSLHFIEHDILAKTSDIDHAKTLDSLAQVVMGLGERAFSDSGQSQLNFERLI